MARRPGSSPRRARRTPRRSSSEAAPHSDEGGIEQRVATQLSQRLDPALVGPLLRAYRCLTESYHLAKWRPSELEAGDFVEVCYRMIQWLTSSPPAYDPLGAHIPNLAAKLRHLENLPSTHHPSLRLHIPRTLLLLTGVRNQRGVAHTAGEVLPNSADASLLLAACSWVLAELVRLNFSCAPDEAQRLVDSLVVRRAPLLQDFGGFLKILNPALPLVAKIMALLYQRGADGATDDEVSRWLQVTSQQRPSLRATLSRLDRERGWIYRADRRNFVTLAGVAWVEQDPGLSPLLH